MLFLTLLPFLTLVLALPAPAPFPQTTCGSDAYTAQQIQDAVDAACNYVSEGSTAGSSKYPESYQDREGFTFDGVDGPYYEFPILERGVYSGGSPGADRIVINDQCQLAGEITHTGSSVKNGFVGCDGTS